jgi:hypothetical protein
MSEETPVSYQGAVLGTPVLSATGAQIGTLEHVLEVPDLDLFDGVVVATHHGLRFIDADRVTRITRSHLETDLDDEQAARLPAPDGPPVYHADALQYSGHELRDFLGRTFGRPHWTREHN